MQYILQFLDFQKLITFFIVHIVGRKKVSIKEKTRVLTISEDGVPVIRVAANLHVSRQANYDLKRAAARLPPGTTPPRKVGTGAEKKTTTRTDALIRREVMMYPSETAASLKKHAQLLQEVSVRTIKHRLQKDLKIPCHRAAKKQLLTRKTILFCKKYKHWIMVDWSKVKFSDESTFRLVKGGYNLVRRPPGVSRCTIKIVKYPESIMVWRAFSGDMGRVGLHFPPKNVTMRGDNYLRYHFRTNNEKSTNLSKL